MLRPSTVRTRVCLTVTKSVLLTVSIVCDHRTNVVMNYSEVEARVREATNDDAWGPHGAIMHEISQYTFTYEHFPEVMSMLWKRMLHESKKNWRRVYKVMCVLQIQDSCCSNSIGNIESICLLV